LHSSLEMSLQNKTAIISGASKGIGAAIAKELASEGCSLCLIGRNSKNLENVKKECQKISVASSKHIILTGDITDAAFRQQIIDTSTAAFDQIDILINNAGTMQLGCVEDSPLEKFDSIFDINFRVHYDMSRKCIPHLVKSKGCIINISSVMSVRPNHIVTPYAIAKAALDQLTTCMAAELGPKGVRVISINPAVIATDLWKLDGLSDEACAEFMKSLESSHALKRIGKPEEVAKVVATMVSQSASFITGSRILIDGGMSTLPPA